MRLCANCNNDISHLRKDARFCGRKCKEVAGKRRPERRATREAWRKANPGKMAQQRLRHAPVLKEWKENNPDRVKFSSKVHCARRRSVPSYVFTEKDWRRLQARFNGCCAYCGSAGSLELEHVVPLARGGTNGAGNHLPACPPCNRSKGSSLLSEWKLRIRKAA